MLKKIASGYGKLFYSIIKIILLAFLCFGFSFIIVYPLWKWALSSPNTYSIAILFLLVAFICFTIIKRIRKQGALISLQRFAKVFIILCGISGCIFSVLQNKRILALIILIAAFIIYGILAYGLKDIKKTSKVENKTQDKNFNTIEE